jgi:hypothetical protein
VRADVEPGDDVDAAIAPLLLEPVSGEGPSWHLSSRGERWQLQEYLVHRSIYHLKEADPQAWDRPAARGPRQGGLRDGAARRVRRGPR